MGHWLTRQSYTLNQVSTGLCRGPIEIDNDAVQELLRSKKHGVSAVVDGMSVSSDLNNCRLAKQTGKSHKPYKHINAQAYFRGVGCVGKVNLSIK